MAHLDRAADCDAEGSSPLVVEGSSDGVSMFKLSSCDKRTKKQPKRGHTEEIQEQRISRVAMVRDPVGTSHQSTAKDDTTFRRPTTQKFVGEYKRMSAFGTAAIDLETTFTRRQSLEVLSSRVSDLLEGLDFAGGEEAAAERPDDAQTKFVRFRQKLETLFFPRPCDQKEETLTDSTIDKATAEELFSELDEIGTHDTYRHVSSAFMGELVETVQILLKESMPSSIEDSSGLNPSASLREANPLLIRIKEHIRRLAKNHSTGLTDMQTALLSVQEEVERLGSHLNRLQQERNDLVHLVSSGQEIMADLVKENESLEHQLSLHITQQKKTLLGESADAHSNCEAIENGSERVLARSRSESYNEDDLLRLVFKEKTKSELLQQQAKHLAIQATNAQKELQELKAQRMDVMGALDQEEWMKDRDRLLQLLEDEKDKISTWKEEQEELLQQLMAANKKITLLETERDELRKATSETSWNAHREELIDQKNKDQQKISALVAECETHRNDIQRLQKEKLKTEHENAKLKEDLTGGSAWERQELSLKLTVAEKQNRLLELGEENAALHATIQEQRTRLEEYQAETDVLLKQVDEVAWADDRRELLQALEQEIDKRSSWEEERTTTEQQIAAMTEELATIKAENASLSASLDVTSWAREREELCRALEEEKEKLSSWTEEIEALEEENKELKWVFHETKEKDIIIQDKEEAIESLNEQRELLNSKLAVKQEEIQQLSSVLHSSPEVWMQEKVALVDQVAELKLARAAIEEGFKQEALKCQECLVQIEELEIELDRVQREMVALKSSTSTRKHVSWGSASMIDIPEQSVPTPMQLSINISRSNSRFDNAPTNADSAAQLPCHLSVRVPHHRSKSIPPSVQF